MLIFHWGSLIRQLRDLLGSQQRAQKKSFTLNLKEVVSQRRREMVLHFFRKKDGWGKMDEFAMKLGKYDFEILQGNLLCYGSHFLHFHFIFDRRVYGIMSELIQVCGVESDPWVSWRTWWSLCISAASQIRWHMPIGKETAVPIISLRCYDHFRSSAWGADESSSGLPTKTCHQLSSDQSPGYLLCRWTQFYREYTYRLYYPVLIRDYLIIAVK